MKRRLPALLAAGVPLAAAGVIYAPVSASAGPVPTAPLAAASPASFACTSFRLSAPDGTTVESVTAAAVPTGTFQVPGAPPLGGYPVPDVPAHCEVTVTLTHPGANDHAKVQIWLPQSGWNGRFQADGGAAYAAGNIGSVAAAVKQGYAAATTDAGVDTGGLDSSWALNSQGRINTALLQDFASRSAHEMAIVGKQVVDDAYGHAASYSYFNGCSTGGRQGYMEAQQYPTDFNGINADAPAINWNQFEVATLWPQVVMNQEHTYPTTCEFNAFNQAALKACDKLDGVVDGLISDPNRCDFDPRRLIGTTVVCDGKQYTITAADADVVRKIWDGPRDTNGKRLWYGLPIGADFSYLAAGKTDANGVTTGLPFIVPAQWVANFVEKQPSFNTANLSYAQFDEIFQKARAEYDSVIGTRDADLSAFRNAGGKLITWQGDADQLIPTAGTVDYRKRVDALMGGTKKVDDFYRVFLAPGVAHCGLNGGNVDDLAALTAWVEQGQAPNVLHATLPTASGGTVARDVCRYPMVSRYTGHGDPSAASSFRCVKAQRD
ncbi:tannase/feruloyl esterase family alpha/beta hydrolase [Kitasatospora acidiphila]|uniref:Tannase/feruloyl esterase family alpha/beta hydrolase n=1 Tax=Kitasatospora acidiphila TaxID=2567942 RepID=A0A540W126_9ACTN|nr:tannase/feruloyl esterase family alpha/beta hydrolase [Kitasatospora acidiphila]TQF02703.1 tannase/feruloyl esterase family alpha/beta hydrolase [Kitasatospora acidiphila]